MTSTVLPFRQSKPAGVVWIRGSVVRPCWVVVHLQPKKPRPVPISRPLPTLAFAEAFGRQQAKMMGARFVEGDVG